MIQALGILATSFAASGTGGYPVNEVMAAFKDVCDVAGDEKAIIAHATTSGWKQSPPEINRRVGREISSFWNSRRPATTGLVFSFDAFTPKFASGFVRTVAGEYLVLIIANSDRGAKNATQCTVIDENEGRKPTKKLLEMSAGRKISDEENTPGYSAWKWVPGLSPRQQGVQISYSRAGSGVAKLTGFYGLRFKAVISSN